MEDPKVLGFVCRHATDMIEERIEPLVQNGVRIYPFTCSASVLPATVIEMFTKGADVVFFLVCGEDSCRYYDGHEKVQRNMTGIEAMLEDLGLESERLLLSYADKYDGNPLNGILAESMNRAKELSQNPYGSQRARVADDDKKGAGDDKSSQAKKGEHEK